MLTVGAQFQVPNFTKKDACRDKSAVHVQLVSQRPCTSTIDCFGSDGDIPDRVRQRTSGQQQLTA